MKERPILFSGPMVRAILEGRKTMTRRVVKPDGAHHLFPFLDLPGNQTGEWAWCSSSHVVSKHIHCPYGQVGDRLWVRESFQPLFADGVENHWETDWKTGKGYAISYPATDGIHEYLDADDNLTDACKPSIHMPRWASRILLEITAVRVERLQDISEADAIAEGISADLDGRYHCGFDEAGEIKCKSPVTAYAWLWNGINGADSWAANPWVWVVEFKRVQP